MQHKRLYFGLCACNGWLARWGPTSFTQENLVFPPAAVEGKNATSFQLNLISFV